MEFRIEFYEFTLKPIPPRQYNKKNFHTSFTLGRFQKPINPVIVGLGGNYSLNVENVRDGVG